MKTISVDEASLNDCVNDAQTERVVFTRDGAPVALLVGIQGLDEEQIALGSSDEFWTLIAERRRQKSISRAELDARLNTSP